MGVVFSLLAISFSWAIATFPGEWQEDLLAAWGGTKWVVAAHNWLFSAEPDEDTHRRFPFSNTLVLPGLNVYEGLNPWQVGRQRSSVDPTLGPPGRLLGRCGLFGLGVPSRLDLLGLFQSQQELIFGQVLGAAAEMVTLQGLERGVHMARLEQLHRQANGLHLGKEPLRQRPGFQATLASFRILPCTSTMHTLALVNDTSMPA